MHYHALRVMLQLLAHSQPGVIYHSHASHALQMHSSPSPPPAARHRPLPSTTLPPMSPTDRAPEASAELGSPQLRCPQPQLQPPDDSASELEVYKAWAETKIALMLQRLREAERLRREEAMHCQNETSKLRKVSATHAVTGITTWMPQAVRSRGGYGVCLRPCSHCPVTSDDLIYTGRHLLFPSLNEIVFLSPAFQECSPSQAP